MNRDFPRSVVWLVKAMVPRLKKSVRKNIDEAAAFCTANLPGETEKEIETVNEKIARVDERVKNGGGASLGELGPIISKVTDYGISYLQKVKSRHRKIANFDPLVFERLATAKIRLVEASMPEKFAIINKQRHAG